MSHLPQPRYTPEEYLALERKANYKSEYVNGFIYAMAGTSLEHNRIVTNLSREIGNQFRGRPCDVFTQDMRVKVSPTGMYCYPDLVALCKGVRLDDSYRDTLLNPSLVVEVLSPSTEAYDRGEKFAHYRRLESLEEYVIISQDKVLLEHYARQGEQWVLTEYRDLQGRLKLKSIDCTLELREIYNRIEFPDEVARANQAGR